MKIPLALYGAVVVLYDGLSALEEHEVHRREVNDWPNEDMDPRSTTA